MDVINLYTLENCPKCAILKKKCSNSKYVQNSDFSIITIDPSNKDDTDVQLLIEKGISQMPVLLVNNTFYDFDDAIKYIAARDDFVK